MSKRRDIIKDIDYRLLIAVVAACLFGLVILNSASMSLRTGASIMRSQKAATILGFVGLIVLATIDYINY